MTLVYKVALSPRQNELDSQKKWEIPALFFGKYVDFLNKSTKRVMYGFPKAGGQKDRHTNKYRQTDRQTDTDTGTDRHRHRHKH